MKKTKIAFIINICIFALEVFAFAWMASGNSSGPLTAARLSVLKYFTVDSNILMGVCALITAIEQYKILKGKREDLSLFTYVFDLVSVTGVTLTMIITIFFLTPLVASTRGWFSLFYYSNFFLHLVNPILSIVVFLAFEKTKKISFKQTLYALIPVILYGIYYIAITLTHMTDGVIEEGYDWYGFFFLGMKSLFVVLPAMILIAYGLAVALWKINRLKIEAKE